VLIATGMTRLALAFLSSVVMLGPVVDQTQPDFTGTWTMDVARSGSPTHEGFVGPVVWTIHQSPKAFVLDRKHGEKSLAFTYVWQDIAADVSRDATVSPSGDHRASWDGSRLVIHTLQAIQGKTVTTRETLSLTGDGRELTVERVLEVEHGYTMKDAKNFTVVKDVFVRATP
jgi:hypothetical protein